MPARLHALVAAAKKHGIAVTTPKRGSHWKAYSADGKSYRIPAHNGEKTEVSDVYIKGFCRSFGLDYDSFKEDL